MPPKQCCIVAIRCRFPRFGFAGTSRRARWQPHAEANAPSGYAVHLHFDLEQGAQALDDRQTEPQSLAAVPRGIVELKKLLEDPLLHLERDTGPVVTDQKNHLRADVSALDFH